MTRSEATNTFQEGLIMDLNPLTTPNTVLTSALNATLVTFNGNEYVLQNDMGNGRVETAYLPEGFVPMGVTELGGIIYIVSYNPLRDKCQIGCFPSPERNISSDELGQPTNTLRWDQFTDGNGNIKTALVKINLLDKKLNPGDKFIVYTIDDALQHNSQKLSDYGDESHTIGSIPRLLRLHLVSIDDENKITYLDSTLKWYDNNYIIPKLEENSSTGFPDIDSYRSLVSSAYNVFNSKISGKLCLLAELETIDSFSCTWDAQIEDQGETQKKGTIKFILGWNSDNLQYINPTYAILTEYDYNGISSTVGKNYGYEITSQDISNNQTKQETETELGDFVYNPEDLQDTIFNYEVTPAMSFGKLTYLAIRGSINFSELGSGKIELSEWRYYIQNDSFLLSWGLDAYPEINKEITGVEFRFIPYDIGVNPESKIATYLITGRTSYSGNFTDTINLNTVTDSYKLKGSIKSNKLYLVQITVKYGREGSASIDEYRYFTRWLYTTTIFNQAYLEGEVVDFDVLPLNLGLSSQAQIKNNTTYTEITDYFPTLFRDVEDPELNLESTLGAYIYMINAKDDNPNNVQVTFNTTVQEDWNLFSLNPEKVSYQNTLGNSEIVVSDYTQISENPAYTDKEFMDVLYDTTEELETSTGQLYPNYNTDGYRMWQKNPEDEDRYTNWKRYKDTFVASAESGFESKSQFNLTFKGVAYNKVSATLGRSSVAIETVFAPFIYDALTAGNFNMSFSGDNFYTTEYLYMGGTGVGGDPDKFSSGSLIINGSTGYSSNRMVWSAGGDDVRMDVTDANIQNLYKSPAKNIEGTFIPCIIAIGDNEGGNANNVDKKDAVISSSWAFGGGSNYLCDLHGNVGEVWNIPYDLVAYLIIISQSGLYLPINMFVKMAQSGGGKLTGGLSNQTFADLIYAFLCQIYRVYKTPTSVTKYIVQYVNYVSRYTETWTKYINSTLSIQTDTLNDVILLGESQIPLNQTLINTIKSYVTVREDELSSAASDNNITPVIPSINLNIPASIDLVFSYPLLETYLSKKSASYGTMVRYNSGKIDYLEGTKSPNSIYYEDGTGDFRTLDAQFVPKRVTGVKLADDQTFIATFSNDNAVSGINFANYLKYDSAEERLTIGDSNWKQDGNTFWLLFNTDKSDPGITNFRGTFTLDSRFKI